MVTKRGAEAVDELERRVGDQVRAARKRAGHTQKQLADLANVSLGTIKNLEAGTGSTLTTLIRVLRALEREEWLETLYVEQSVFNPLDLLASDGGR